MAVVNDGYRRSEEGQHLEAAVGDGLGEVCPRGRLGGGEVVDRTSELLEAYLRVRGLEVDTPPRLGLVLVGEEELRVGASALLEGGAWGGKCGIAEGRVRRVLHLEGTLDGATRTTRRLGSGDVAEREAIASHLVQLPDDPGRHGGGYLDELLGSDDVMRFLVRKYPLCKILDQADLWTVVGRLRLEGQHHVPEV